MKNNDGGPAFPVENIRSENTRTGMSLRDWFAGQALSGMLARSVDRTSKRDVAVDAYQYADAMLAEREKGE